MRSSSLSLFWLVCSFHNGQFYLLFLKKQWWCLTQTNKNFIDYYSQFMHILITTYGHLFVNLHTTFVSYNGRYV